MQINYLSLSQFRGIQDASFSFKPGFNLIVGVNGAGKSSVLDALCIVLARVLPVLTPSGTHSGVATKISDITINKNELSIIAKFTCHATDFALTLTEQVSNVQSAVDQDRGLKDIRDVDELPTLRRQERPEQGDPRLAGTLRGQTSINPEAQELTPSPDPKLKKAPNQPLVLFLSVRRSIPNSKAVVSKKSSAYQAVFNIERGLEIQTLAQWWKARESLAAEDQNSKSAIQLAAAKIALQEMLPGMTDWRIKGEQVMVDKIVKVSGISSSGAPEMRDERRALPISSLSDGEKSLIAITTDIAQRLAVLNPNEIDPIKTGNGVVLLDEIDLHLHPSWQRHIAINLPKVFPGLQFIATTHSPQVIGETEPGRAMLLHAGGRVEYLDESLGRDSGWILRHVMGTPERNEELQRGLDEIDQLIDGDNFQAAREKVHSLRNRFGNDRELVGAAAAIARWEPSGDEENN
ncbi:AAA family ATPase [Polaromonas glacialis]|uniref:AAA family ATPase n=1 Tax=Polaromonas glacialis TaxID=866564 RepID=UPI00055F56F5|nr:AAA family ATPase [Polaromonas glacialis]